MDLGIAVSCDDSFHGSNCTQCVPGSSCVSAAVDDDKCVGVDCGSGDCVGDSDSFRCICDPGFAGDFCDDDSTNASKQPGYLYILL